MRDISEPSVALGVAELVLANTVVLGGLLALFRSGERGYFASYGVGGGWAILFGVSAAFAVLAFVEQPLLLPLVVFWAIILVVFLLKLWQGCLVTGAQALFCWLHATPDLFDPFITLSTVLYVFANSVLHAGLLRLFRPGDQGYFASYGVVGGWTIILAASTMVAVLGLLEVPSIVPLVLWCLIALLVFRLTIRQTIMAVFAQGLVNLLLLVGLVALLV